MLRVFFSATSEHEYYELVARVNLEPHPVYWPFETVTSNHGLKVLLIINYYTSLTNLTNLTQGDEPFLIAFICPTIQIRITRVCGVFANGTQSHESSLL